jgi:hypothetical protein
MQKASQRRLKVKFPKFPAIAMAIKTTVAIDKNMLKHLIKCKVKAMKIQ